VRSLQGENTSVSISNLATIEELKQKYLEARNDPSLGVENLRMFCMGKELKNEFFVYTYNLADEMTIQVQIKK